jgi:hypothetical protein
MSIDGSSANAPIDNPSASQRVCSAEWLLSGEPFKESTFSCSHFHRPSCPFAFFYTPGLVHVLLQSNNDRVAYIESFSSLSCRIYHPLPFQPLAISLHLTVFDVPCCNFLSIDQLKNDETGFYKFTCTFATLKFGGGF